MTIATVQKPVPTAANLSIADDELYEIIDGQRVGLPPMGIRAAWIATQLVQHLGYLNRAQNLGHTVGEGLFRLPLPIDRNRRPDVAFVTYDRWAKDRPLPESDNAWDVLPNLAVEVISPTDLAEDVQVKVAEYLRAGVTLVWVVFPRTGQVHVYESPSTICVLSRTDELDGGTLLPGFRLALTELFLESAPNGPAA
jgi:Uma2 family endonuclease